MGERVEIMRGCGPLLLVLLLAAVSADDVPLGFFLRSLPAEAPKNVSLAGASTGMSQQFSVYRVVPGLWHSKDHYHFDGLAYVMKLTFAPPTAATCCASTPRPCRSWTASNCPTWSRSTP